MQSQGRTLDQNIDVSNNKCIVILYRNKDSANIEQVSPILTRMKTVQHNADESSTYEITPDQIPWGGYDSFHSKHPDATTINVYNLVIPLLSMYVLNPNRIEIFHESEEDIRYMPNKNLPDKNGKFFTAVSPPYEKFKRRLMVEFKMPKENLIELLSGMNTTFEGYKTTNLENIKKAYHQLQQSISMARFDYFSAQSNQYIPYKIMRKSSIFEALVIDDTPEMGCSCNLF